MVYESCSSNHGWRRCSVRVRSRNFAQAAICAGLVALALAWPTPLAEARAVPENGQQKCLASAIYHEARGEPVKTQRAVVDTILHRSLESDKSVCEVVAQRHQFSWFRRKGLKPYDAKQQALLSEALSHPKVLRNEKTRWFYSGPKPAWAYKMDCRPIGKLNFCKEKK